MDMLTNKDFKVPVGHELISLDVESLYNNVPVFEAVNLATNESVSWMKPHHLRKKPSGNY